MDIITKFLKFGDTIILIQVMTLFDGDIGWKTLHFITFKIIVSMENF